MTVRGTFISDLHLLSRRSVGQKCWQDLQPEIRNSDLLILGGDIFDFRWSSHGDLTRSLEAAKQWLQLAIQANDHLRVIYLLGNHDCLNSMQSMLRELAQEVPKFCWTAQHLALDQCVFLHGDVLDAGLSEIELNQYRSKFSAAHRERGQLAHRLYDMLVASRIHGVPPKFIHSSSRVTKRLAQYLTSLELTAESGIHEVYFGHTHQPLQGISYKNQLFFNAGSGVKHLPFNPCRFEVEVDIDQVVEALTIDPERPLRIKA